MKANYNIRVEAIGSDGEEVEWSNQSKRFKTTQEKTEK
jgi:hypothetical protein